MKVNKEHGHINIKKLILSLILIGINCPAFAGSGDIGSITDALNGFISILTGTTATLLATITIIGLGYFWMIGKLSLQLAGRICLGIGVIFGAAQILSALGIG